MGCMSFFVIGLIALFVLLGCGWFFYVKTVNNLTADRPVEVAVTTPTAVEYSAANAKLTQFRAALRQEQAATVSFSAADLNALIARDPDFASSRGKLRVSIADSVATMEMSVRLDSLPFPRLSHRWFNGSTRFRFNYNDGDFVFDPLWIEANDHRFSGSFLRSFTSSFNRSFSKSFEESMEKNRGGSFWKNVKTMTLEGDQLIITTRGEAGSTI